jgi:NitT/TauT family transport system permease protein
MRPRMAFSIQLLTVAAVLVAWELIVRLRYSESLVVVSPTQTFARVGDLASTEIRSALMSAAIEFLWAFAISAVAGVVLGVLLSMSKNSYTFARDAVGVAISLPQVAVYPLFTLWLGIGAASKVAFGVSHGVLPIILATMIAGRSVDPSLVRAVKAMGGGRIQVARRVLMPSMVPEVIGGLGIGAAMSLLGVLLAEMLLSVGGLGQLLATLSATFSTATLYNVIAVICLVAVAINMILRYTGSRFSRWRT